MSSRSTSYGIHACVLGILITASGLVPSASAFAGNGVHRTTPTVQQGTHPSESRSVIQRETHPKRDVGDRSRTGTAPGKPVPTIRTKEKPSRDGIPEFSMEIPR